MKFILGAILIILAIGSIGFLLPAIIGIVIGISMISSGSVIGGLIAITAGIIINICMLVGSAAEAGFSSGSGRVHIDNECPNCGSDDTDGNHCYTCEDDF